MPRFVNRYSIFYQKGSKAKNIQLRTQIFLAAIVTLATYSSKSFLFSLYNINGYSPVKVNIKSSRYSNAIYTFFTMGPTFGNGYDLYIYNNAASNRYSYTYCDWSYPLPPGYSASSSSCRFYAGGSSMYFIPADVEVFYETTT